MIAKEHNSKVLFLECFRKSTKNKKKTELLGEVSVLDPKMFFWFSLIFGLFEGVLTSDNAKNIKRKVFLVFGELFNIKL